MRFVCHEAATMSRKENRPRRLKAEHYWRSALRGAGILACRIAGFQPSSGGYSPAPYTYFCCSADLRVCCGAGFQPNAQPFALPLGTRHNNQTCREANQRKNNGSTNRNRMERNFRSARGASNSNRLGPRGRRRNSCLQLLYGALRKWISIQLPRRLR